jgi:hypothetical protein
MKSRCLKYLNRLKENKGILFITHAVMNKMKAPAQCGYRHCSGVLFLTPVHTSFIPPLFPSSSHQSIYLPTRDRYRQLRSK